MQLHPHALLQGHGDDDFTKSEVMGDNFFGCESGTSGQGGALALLLVGLSVLALVGRRRGACLVLLLALASPGAARAQEQAKPSANIARIALSNAWTAEMRRSARDNGGWVVLENMRLTRHPGPGSDGALGS